LQVSNRQTLASFKLSNSVSAIPAVYILCSIVIWPDIRAAWCFSSCELSCRGVGCTLLRCYNVQPYTQGCSVELRPCLYCVFAVLKCAEGTLSVFYLFVLTQRFPNFFWSRTICGPCIFTAYHLENTLFQENSIYPISFDRKVCQTRLDANAAWTTWLWETVMAIFQN